VFELVVGRLVDAELGKVVRQHRFATGESDAHPSEARPMGNTEHDDVLWRR